MVGSYAGGIFLGKSIAFVSGKGGTGKTTCAAAIGSCLAALGHKTLLIDCDSGLRNLDLALGMADFAVDDFSDIIENRVSASDAVSRHPVIDNLFFLAAPPDRTPDEINPAEFSKLLSSAKQEYEFVLTDSPAGIGSGFLLALRECDIAIIVTTPESSAVRDAARAAEEILELNIPAARMIINRASKSEHYIDAIIDDVGVRLIGLVRYDSAVPITAEQGVALVLGSTRGAARDLLNVTLKLLEV